MEGQGGQSCVLFISTPRYFAVSLNSSSRSFSASRCMAKASANRPRRCIEGVKVKVKVKVEVKVEVKVKVKVMVMLKQAGAGRSGMSTSRSYTAVAPSTASSPGRLDMPCL